VTQVAVPKDSGHSLATYQSLRNVPIKQCAEPPICALIAGSLARAKPTAGELMEE